MSSKIFEHDNSHDEPSDNSMLDSFNLFLSLMTPLEFAKLLRSRVSHLLQTWPPPSSSDDSQGQNDASSPSNRLPYLSMDSVLAFTSFFRTQDTPIMSESGTKFTLSSPNHIHQHLKALETLLSCLAPKELQDLIKSRLIEGGKERTEAIRGLMDVMRRAATIDETPEDKTFPEKSSLHLNLVPNVEEIETQSTNTYTVNLSPGTAHIPRVMSPGTRDQSADDSNLQNGDSQKTGFQYSRKHEPRQSTPLLSPVLSTSKVSTSPITIPTERGNRRIAKLGKEAVLNSPGSRQDDFTSKSKSSASSPYPKVPQSTRRTRSSGALVPEPSTSRRQNTVRTPEKPRRKSERLSKRNQPVTRSKKSQQSLKKEPTMSPSPPSDANPLPPNSSATSPRNELSPVGASDHASSSFFHSSADGRKSPPGPVLRAVDWSTPVQSTPISTDEDHEMEEEEEELDELADDSSEGGNHVSEIVDGWNSHIVDGEPETAPPPSDAPSHAESPLTDRTPPVPTTPVLKEEMIPNEVVLTLPPETSSPIPPLVSSRSSPSVTEPIISTDRQSVIDVASNAASVSVPQDQMEVDLPPRVLPDLPAPGPTAPPPIPSPVYPPLYSSPLPPPGHSSYPQVGPPTLNSQPPHSSQSPPAPSIHHSPHTPTVVGHTSYTPSSQPPPAAHHPVNPYPPPLPPNHNHHSYAHDYHPPPPPPHMPPYPLQHPPYTPSPWYGNPYYPPPNHQPPPSYHQYPQQLGMPMPPNRDQHPATHLRPSHLPHSQSYPPPHYPQQPQPIPPPQFPSMQTPQRQFPPQDNQNQYPPPQPSVNHYHHHPPPSFPPSAPSTLYSHPSSSMQQQQQGLSHPHHPPSQSTSVHLPHHFPSLHSHLAQPVAHSLHDNRSPDTTGPRSGLYTMNNNNSVPTAMSVPRPPSPIIPPPLGPRPPPLININSLPPSQRRSPSPPVKPPEGPKRFFQKRRTDEEGGDVNFQGAGGGDQDDPNIRYTSEVGIKETSSVRRRCHNCRTVEAPSWRKSKLSIGKICGIYESTHLMARPLKTRPRRLMLNGERDLYQFEIYNASPITPFGSPTSSGLQRRRMGSTSDNEDDFDFDD
ncbi:hypothetical protein Clacol_005975 [Clathrus columnatus]|uniref:GATA-type domain-containing protein n=1 Tax=Clathrus columnatus TaxID=1419009 RepID=A0AAV5ADF9_9AGAM|nr:hypothetical protein Clacol_005975 [Clathrus columnatus]